MDQTSLMFSRNSTFVTFDTNCHSKCQNLHFLHLNSSQLEYLLGLTRRLCRVLSFIWSDQEDDRRAAAACPLSPEPIFEVTHTSHQSRLKCISRQNILCRSLVNKDLVGPIYFWLYVKICVCDSIGFECWVKFNYVSLFFHLTFRRIIPGMKVNLQILLWIFGKYTECATLLPNISYELCLLKSVYGINIDQLRKFSFWGKWGKFYIYRSLLTHYGIFIRLR